MYRYYICMYFCVHVCIINIYVNGSINIFSCFPCYFVFKMTAPLFLSPIIRFNKSYWLYFQLLPILYFCTIIRLHCHTVSCMGLRIDIFIIYVLLRDTTSLCNPLVLCFWREINLSWHSCIMIKYFRSLLTQTIYIIIKWLFLWYNNRSLVCNLSVNS